MRTLIVAIVAAIFFGSITWFALVSGQARASIGPCRMGIDNPTIQFAFNPPKDVVCYIKSYRNDKYYIKEVTRCERPCMADEGPI